MEFFIKKNATLPVLKLQVVKDGRSDYNKMMDEAEQQKVRRIARSGNITAVMDKRKETGRVSESADSSISAKAKKSGISVGTLRKVYKRGVAAWNSGHRPGTTPQQWGHARVNSYINKGKTYHTADKDLREEADIDELFEMQLVGTDEYRKHAIAMTPGQNQEIENAYTATKSVTAKEDCDCGGECDECNEQDGTGLSGNVRSFSEIRKGIKEAKKEEVIDATPTLKPKKEKLTSVGPKYYRGDLQGLPVTARFNALEAKDPYGFMPTPRQVPGPKAGHPVPPGYERVKSWGGAYELRKIREKPATVKEAVEYHMENEISFTENVFRPGSEMFFEMIAEAKKLYKEGKYTPADEFELDMLNSDIGEKVIFEGQEVILDYPFEEELNEEDKTGGKGIGKPWREGGGGAVYVRDGGSIPCRMSIEKSTNNNEWNAGAMSQQFGNFINQRIVLSRKASQPYTNTLVAVNKVWVAKPDSPMGQPTLNNKGGNTMYFDSSLVITFGNIARAGTNKIKATKNGKEVEFAKRTRISCDKNHVTGVTAVNKVIMTVHGFINDDKKELDEYKKKYSDQWMKVLGSSTFDVVEEETALSPDIFDCCILVLITFY